MNLSLDLGDSANTALQPRGGMKGRSRNSRNGCSRTRLADPGHSHQAGARKPVLARCPEAIDTRLRDALAARASQQLYTHQAEAFEHAAAGKNVVVVTPTASGKTLCYNLPVLNAVLTRSRRARPVSVPHQGAGRRPTA